MNHNLLVTLISPFSPLINLSIFTLFFLARRTLSADYHYETCTQPKSCAYGPNISFPFYIQDHQENFCGFPGFNLSCNNNGYPILTLSNNNYTIQEIFYNNQSLLISNAAVFDTNTSCIPPFQNVSLLDDRFKYANPNQPELFLLYNCNNSSQPKNLSAYTFDCVGENESGHILAVMREEYPNLGNESRNCTSVVAVPVDHVYGGETEKGFEEILRKGFVLNWTASGCSVCKASGGMCGFDYNTFHFKCFCPDRPHAWHCIPAEKKRLGMKLGLGIGGLALLVTCSVYILWLLYKRKNTIRSSTSNLSSKSDLEGIGDYFGVHIFSYRELEEATNHFNSEKELGDGGFGTVYHGKLRDGREVAVKRLYEHNYRRVEQFMNEVEILTHLRHKNLVSLYGCTSRRSRELLLVYEFIPNGTVADHLHGDLAQSDSLAWSIRMSIAIETASALSYLHASDIIHRDVKTDNILLDNNFCVKVADFGLSRLFPNDVTHVSTAPQGTPGYVDPEYHQYYQLTNKSDVYSFGVVLIELVSSMPAVDITRHRHEINLANLAMKKIQKCAFNELIDPFLGYETDEEVKRMTTSVAVLGFKCLQPDKEMRPSMDEVLDELKRIQSGKSKLEKNLKEGNDDNEAEKFTLPPPSPTDCDEVELLKNVRLPPSPVSVTVKWVSESTTPNVSG